MREREGVWGIGSEEGMWGREGGKLVVRGGEGWGKEGRKGMAEEETDYDALSIFFLFLFCTSSSKILLERWLEEAGRD